MGVCVYFELNMWAHTAMEDNLLEELLGIANYDALVEFGSSNLHHLLQPLSHWEWGDVDDQSFSIPVVPLEMCRSHGFIK